jgi:hypothetical protein
MNQDQPYTLADYRNAPSGEGPLAAEWADKPHRLVYDLVAKLEKMRTDEEIQRAVELMNHQIIELGPQTPLWALACALKLCLEWTQGDFNDFGQMLADTEAKIALEGKSCPN